MRPHLRFEQVEHCGRSRLYSLRTHFYTTCCSALVGLDDPAVAAHVAQRAAACAVGRPMGCSWAVSSHSTLQCDNRPECRQVVLSVLLATAHAIKLLYQHVAPLEQNGHVKADANE